MGHLLRNAGPVDAILGDGRSSAQMRADGQTHGSSQLVANALLWRDGEEGVQVNIFERDGWRVSSPYGWRTHPITGVRHFHRGIDVVKAHRHPIPAWVGGEVMLAAEERAGTGLGGYGITVAIKDRNHHLHIYAHLDEVAVRQGQTVATGTIVGYQGNTGVSTGGHLHYEVRQRHTPYYGWDTEVDPGAYLDSILPAESEDLEQWKLAAVDYLADQGISTDSAGWKQKIDEPMPTWAVCVMLRQVLEKI